MDPDLIVPDPSLTIRQGAVEPWASGMERGEGWTFEFVEHLARSLKLDLDTPWAKLPQAPRAISSCTAPRPSTGVRHRLEFEGVVNQLYRRFKTTGSEAMRRDYMRYFSDKPCPTCAGERLKPESRAVSIRGRGIVDLSRLTIQSRRTRGSASLGLKGSEAKIADELLKEIKNRLKFLLDVGLGYLTLDRPGPSLSGGESQRIRLASQMGSELTGVIYILDEPSIGLHQRDNGKLLATLKRLRDVGNSVIVVEHDEETMEEADWLVDFGPGAGAHGGEIVSPGHARRGEARPGVAHRRVPLRPAARSPSPSGGAAADHGAITIAGRRRANNLKDVTVVVPARPVHGGDRRLRRGQVDARERDPAPGADAPPLRHARGAREARGALRPRADRQGHRHQPAAHRPHAALEPRDLHQGVRRHPRRVRADARGARVRVPARAASAST